MKKDSNNKAKKSSKSIIIGIISLGLAVILVSIIVGLNGVNIIRDIIGINNEALNTTKTIAEYEIIRKDEETNELEILVTIENENGIDTIEIANAVINANGRKKVSFDRKLVEDSITSIEVGLIEGSKERFELVPSSGYVGSVRTTESKIGEEDWKRKVEISAESSRKPVYYTLDGENWELLEDKIILSNVETDKIMFNKMENDIWEVRKKDNIETGGYDTITEFIGSMIDESGYYKAVIKNEQISIHAYVQNENVEVSGTAQYGDAGDAGTASTMAQNMVVLKVNGNLTVNEGGYLTAYGTAYGGPKGLYVYVTGKLENNGQISMTARGGKAVGQNVYLYNNNDGTYEYIPAIGGTGGRGLYFNSVGGGSGERGAAGANRRTGGGR